MIASIVLGFLIIDWWNYLIQINISAWYNERKLGQDKMTERKKENKKGLAAPIGATEIDITLISEDIHQPRKEFNQETLRELTETIKLRGVKSPISVRPNPDKPGTYIINHGARRYRASINAGLTKIPAFIDTDYSEADQVIENLQRDDLTSREIADFIGRQLAGGKTKSEIARLIGKTNPYITMHAALLDLPDPLGEVYRSGRCTDVTALYDLTRLYKANKEEVITWLALSTQEEISRLDVYQFSQFLKLKKTPQSNSADDRVSNAEGKSNTAPDNNNDQKQTTPNSLLDSIYNLIKKDKRKPQDLMRDLSSDNKELLKTKISDYFEQGRNCPNIVQFTIKALQDGSFSAKGSGALQLIAFLHGMERSESFDLMKILEEIAGQQEAG
ncbi:ParB family chromosome partitioning protein [Nitrosomonas oligotropha]|uniref:ParB family chromosome partitioning protein n=1 Tax=Nitrosomonas oligotropha TaxID=42354 RepID=A0A2T5I0G7_9PROT|nr:ParB/RepB/Spo0J family partition protein [Nitrosomonas oligotropha]PTQ77325.1 ParB family chromosome partitioning protein [Nitrosomonas oligotropha]